MGKLENDVRIKLDDDMFLWVNHGAKVDDLPRRIFVVRQLKLARRVHEAMRQENEITIKRFRGDFWGMPGLAGATPDYVIEGNYVPARANITYSLPATGGCILRCPFARLGRNPRNSAVPL